MFTSSHNLIYGTTGKRYLPVQFDNLFKELITESWCVKSDGNVEAPIGYFSVTEIPSHEGELKEFKLAFDQYDEWPESGWYVTVEDNAGFIFVYPVESEDQAHALYDQLEAEYVKWDGE